MKKVLSEFYPFEKNYFSHLWKDAIIIPDANILLNLYYYSRKASKELISILYKFSERLWIPYQIALEYQKNRLSKIRAQKESYNSLKKSIQAGIDNIKKVLDDKYSEHPFLEASKIKIILDKSFKDIEQYLNDARDNHPDWEKNDEIRNDLDKLFEDKVGIPYSRDRLKEIYEIGYCRYENKIPPGYGDDKKDKERKFGDLIIWLDIIEKAKKEKKSIIFISDEKKEDWWQKDNNNLIPRYELIGEIRNEANVSFYIYNAEDFATYSYKFLNQTAKKGVINEFRTFRNFANFLENLKLQNEALLASIKPITIPNIDALAAALASAKPITTPNIVALAAALASAKPITTPNIVALVAALASAKPIEDQISEALTRIGAAATVGIVSSVTKPLKDASLFTEAPSRIIKSSTNKSRSLVKNNIKTNKLIKDNNTNKTINKNSDKKEKEDKEEV